MDTVDPYRPTNWDEFIGQARVKMDLEVAIQGAIDRDAPLGHVMLAGKPGVGKTSLAQIVAARLGEDFHKLSMANLKPAALAKFFRQDFISGVVLMDEIHAAPTVTQEQLLTLLEEGYMTSPNGQTIQREWLTVIAATTVPEKVDSALRSRFDHEPRFVDYTPDEMSRIARQIAGKMGFDLADDLAEAFGAAAGDSPRNARRLVRKTQDLRSHLGRPPTVDEVLDLAGVDREGVTIDHMAYLAALDSFGGVAGEKAMIMMLGVGSDRLREIELFLLTRRYIGYGDRGRELTSSGVRKLRGNLPTRGRRSA